MKSFDSLNGSKTFFHGMLEKLLLRKFWKIIKKTSLVVNTHKDVEDVFRSE